MLRILALAAAVAAANTAAGWWLSRRAKAAGGRYWWLHGLAMFVRAGVIFGAAHLVWLHRRRPAEVVVFIVAAAVLQLAGLTWRHLVEEGRGG